MRNQACLPVRKGMTSVPPPGAVITRELARLQIQGWQLTQWQTGRADKQHHRSVFLTYPKLY